MKKRLYSALGRVGNALDFPVCELISESNVCIYGRRECVFFGVGSVLLYEKEKVKLSLCEGEAVVCGKGLSLVVYNKNAAQIKGRIDSVFFAAEK